MDDHPVGIFDSGVGGLSVVEAFQRVAPNEDILYFADTAWFPYGPRPAAEVRKRSFAITQRLVQGGAKLVVVACNTASAAAVDDLRKAFDVPFVGMVPGVKPAAAGSRSRRVVILATEGTFDGELYSRVVEEFGRGTVIVAVPGTGLAEMVEAGDAGSVRSRSALASALDGEMRAGADTIVLGCTHYHFLAPGIRDLYPGVTIVDTSEAVAKRAKHVLDERDLAAPQGREGHLDLICSGDRGAFEHAVRRCGFARPALEAVE
jgi:glutamate racemase